MMTTTYRVLLNGAKADREARQVAAEIERLFKIPFEKALALLAKPSIAVKGGVDLQTAAKYLATLEGIGCAAVVEPEVPVALDLNAADDSGNPLSAGNDQTRQGQADETRAASSPNQSSRSESASADDSVPATQRGTKSSGKTVVKWAGVAIAAMVVVAGVRAWTDPSGAEARASWGSNSLESVLVIGKSKVVDYQHFLDQGGLNKEDVWRGYKVSNTGVFFDSDYGGKSGRYIPFDASMDSGMVPGDVVIAGFSLRLWKDMGGKMASIENLKASLAKDCGDWASALRVGRTLMVEFQGLTCIVTDNGSSVTAGVFPTRMHRQ